MKRALTIAVALLAAACQSSPAVPEITTGVKIVTKPYAVPCVKSVPEAPVPPAIAADADIEQRAAWARIRDAQLRQHVAILRAVLVACTSSIGGTTP